MGQQGLGVTRVARRRAQPAACRAGSSGSDHFTSFVLNITVWRLLSVAGSPLRQIVSWYVFTGRSCWALLVDLQRWLWRAVGWFSAPPRSAALQRFGRPLLNLRRWHYGLGECLGLSPPCRTARRVLRHASQCSRGARAGCWDSAVPRSWPSVLVFARGAVSAGVLRRPPDVSRQPSQ